MVLGMLPVIQWEIPETKVEVEAANEKRRGITPSFIDFKIYNYSLFLLLLVSRYLPLLHLQR